MLGRGKQCIFSDTYLIEEYRLPVSAINNICRMVNYDLSPKLEGDHILSVHYKVLISLKVLASGSFQNAAMHCTNVAQSTVSVVFDAFINSMLKHVCCFINMPTTTPRAADTRLFYEHSDIPNVFRLVDGTHVTST